MTLRVVQFIQTVSGSWLTGSYMRRFLMALFIFKRKLLVSYYWAAQ